jgi:putative transposase
MTDDTKITELHQPGTILDPLTEIARDGARQMLMAALRTCPTSISTYQAP